MQWKSKIHFNVLKYHYSLFKKYPDYAKLFKKFGNCPDDILNNKKFINGHAVNKVFGGISDFVKKIEDPCTADSIMKKLGKRHQKFCMKPEHFKNSRKVFLKSLEFNLGEKWDAEVEEGWNKASAILFGALIKGLKSD